MINEFKNLVDEKPHRWSGDLIADRSWIKVGETQENLESSEITRLADCWLDLEI